MPCCTLLAGFIACRGTTDPLPASARLLQPLAPYRTWWQLVEGCSGLTGSFDAVQWYVADHVSPDDNTVDAKWLSSGNRVVLTPASSRDGGVVRHEMLHALLRRGGHPTEYFGAKCAALVKCELNCAPSEHDRGVSPSARVVDVGSLHVAIHVEPSPPSAGTDSGWVRIIVVATNMLAESVWVSLQGGYPFACYAAGVFSSVENPPGSSWAFRANESRSYTFDAQFAPGSYAISCSFATNRASTFPLQVDP